MLRHSPFLQYALAGLTGAALLVSLSACDAIGEFSELADDSSETELGRVEMRLSGAVKDTLSGIAVFSTTTETNPNTGEEATLFGLAFMPDSADAHAEDAATAGTAPDSWFAAQIVGPSDRPEDGEYSFVRVDPNASFPDDIWSFPEEGFAFSFQTEDTEREAVVASKEGTLTITGSSSAALSGNFSVTTFGMYRTAGMTQANEGTITIEGEFKALGGELPEGTF